LGEKKLRFAHISPFAQNHWGISSTLRTIIVFYLLYKSARDKGNAEQMAKK